MRKVGISPLAGVIVLSGALALAGCPATTGEVIKKDDVKKDNGDDPEKKEDLEKVFEQEQLAAAKYVPGVDEKAQDAFKKGVVAVHQVPPDYEEAQKAFEEAIDIDKNFLEPYFNIAMIQENQRHPDQALATYERALTANPDSADAKAFIGKIYLAKAKDLLDLGKNAEAEQLMQKGKKQFDEVIARDFENVPANNALALYWLLKGDPVKAEDYVKQVLTIEPQNVTALNTRGLIYLNKNELNIAQWIFEQKVLSIDPNSVEAFTNLGIVYVRNGDLPKAVANFKRSVALDSSNIAARMNLGAIYLDFMNYGPALEQYDFVLKVQPNNVEATIGAASSRFGKKDYDKAVDGYLAALKIDPRRTVLLLKVADLYYEKFGSNEDKVKLAIQFYERFVKEANPPPDHRAIKLIPVLKELLAKGMLKPIPDEPPPPPDGEKKPEGDKKPETAPDTKAPPVEAPKTEAPKAEQPKAEPPKAEPPKAEAPKTEDKPRAPEKAPAPETKEGGAK